ncbi:hypothetical protein SAMN07250955_11511 [Arboricoccus pini]|uniref:Uncharacterized protein n=1 Tax=Arboricoccus pini TaxID=1963835 RepID=A0A212RUV3_9PROT|nr:hypothetical protein SAMN07250955_11511 [Arboricoccus pini]
MTIKGRINVLRRLEVTATASRAVFRTAGDMP